MNHPVSLPALVLEHPSMPEKQVRNALLQLPNPRNWRGEPWKPWGRTGNSGKMSIVRAGRDSAFLQGDYGMYDSLRDAFFAERLTGSSQSACGCLRRVSLPTGAHVDTDAQLELMRATLRTLFLAESSIDLDQLTVDLFGGQPLWRQQYLWWLEAEDLIDHVGDEDQSTLTVTAEGMSVLVMLELTRPESNVDMSPAAMLAAEAPKEEGLPVHHATDRPLFLGQR